MTPLELDALILSLQVSVWAVIVSLPPGLFIAWILARLNFPGKALLNGLIHLPLVLPPVAIGYLLLILLGRKGIMGAFLYKAFGITLSFNWKGAALAAAVMAFPLMVRAIRLSIEGVDRGLEFAARTLGASPIRAFFTITLPLIFPGILTGIILTFARSLGEFGATITFVSNIEGETQTLPLALYTLTQIPNGEAGALRLCVIAVGISLITLIASESLTRRYNSRLSGG